MWRRLKGAWFMTGLAVLGATIAGGLEARAGTAGITIDGGFEPTTGDPPYIYIFQVFLDPGFAVVNPSVNTNFFTIERLVGITTNSLHTEPVDFPTVVWINTINQSSAPSPFSSDVTWTFDGTSTITNPNPPGSNIEVYLGQFEVQTSVSFTNGPPVPPGTIINYTFVVEGLNGPVSGTGSFPIVDLTVPEPASIVLLTVGALALPVLVLRARRRRAARTA
jgi:hypothetical protein